MRPLRRKLEKAIAEGRMDIIKELQPMLAKLLDGKENLILLSDAYKYSHHRFYHPGTTSIYSYLESRGGRFMETVFFGLQYIIKEYLEGTVITMEEIDEAEEHLLGTFGRSDVFDRSKFEYIVKNHNGRLPIRIKAVPEGTVVNVKNILMSIENTDPNCFWLTNFLESLILQVWFPITVSTLSREIKKTILKYLVETGCSPAGIEYILNDFGFRGVSSVESAKIGGAAHLVNFRGSDTTVASRMIRQMYGTDTVFGQSIPATEHSITSQEGPEGESNVFDRVLKTFPKGLLACVSDTYNILEACAEKWGTEFKDQIMGRDGVLVIRPDSGDPVQTLLKVFGILMDKFGYTVNEKGYKVLPSQVRVIQGDGINYNSIIEIYEALKLNNIAAENLVLGMGGKLLQDCNRDTQNFAIKSAHTIVDGKGRNVVKKPIEINKDGEIVRSFKESKSGRMKLVVGPDGVLKTVAESAEGVDILQTVFEDGSLIIDQKFEGIRELAKIPEYVLENV